MASVVHELEGVAELCGRVRFSWHPRELQADVLAPVATLLGADSASFRALSWVQGDVVPNAVVSLGIPSSVDDAYLAHYFKFDPARRLLQRRLSRPVFASPTRPGEWAAEHMSAAERERSRAAFRKYRDEFLLPNQFFHHLGFCLQDAAGRALLFDFHRPARSRAFGRLELAKADILATCLHAQVPHSTRRGGVYGSVGGERPLSAREREVAEAVAFGLSNKEVAARFNISVRTVENHMRSLFSKLRVTTRTRLAAKLHEAQASEARTSGRRS